jgi:uncharacterized protein YggU (UPF0235/DUF167 family)
LSAAGEAWRPTGSGVELRVKVTPRARQSGLGGLVTDAGGSGRLAVKVTAPAEAGAADAAVCALLAERLGVARSAVVLRHGASGRRKSVAIAGDATRLTAALCRLAAGARA